MYMTKGLTPTIDWFGLIGLKVTVKVSSVRLVHTVCQRLSRVCGKLPF